MIDRFEQYLDACKLTEKEKKGLQSVIKGSLSQNQRGWNKYTFLIDLLGLLLCDFSKYKMPFTKIFLWVLNSEDKLVPYNLGRFYHIRGYNAWRLKHNVVEAHHYLNRSISILSKRKSLKNLAYLARVHDTFGQILVQKGQLEDAINEYELSSVLRKRTNDIEGYAITLGNIGRLYYESGNFQNAINFLNEDLEIVMKLKHPSTRVIAQLKTNLAFCILEVGDFEEAEELLINSVELNGNESNFVGLAYSNLGLANLYCRIKKYQLSEKLLSEVKEIIHEKEIPQQFLPELRSEYARIFAEVYFKKGALIDATESIQSALEDIQNIPNISPIRRSRLLFKLAKILEKRPGFDQTEEFLRNSLRLADLTEDFQLQSMIEAELKKNNDSWLLHAAGRYLGHKQVDFLIQESGKKDLESELKDVAILFSDIRNFTTFSEKLNPHVLINVLNGYLHIMSRCIDHFNGYIDKYIGDAIMSVFSLPRNKPNGKGNDAEKATLAAIYMQEELIRYNRIRHSSFPKLDSGIGIHIGKVVVGLIGSPQKRSYSVIGDTVNTASRIEGLTKVFGANILVSEEVVLRYQNPEYFLIEYRGNFRVKGKNKPIKIYEVLGINDGSTESKTKKIRIAKMEQAMAFLETSSFQASIDILLELIHECQDLNCVKSYKFIKNIALTKKLEKSKDSWDGVISLSSK